MHKWYIWKLPWSPESVQKLNFCSLTVINSLDKHVVGTSCWPAVVLAIEEIEQLLCQETYGSLRRLDKKISLQLSLQSMLWKKSLHRMQMKGSTFSRIAPLSQFLPPSRLLQTLAFRTGTQRSLWLTCLAFFISLHLLHLQNPVSVMWFHQNKSVSLQIGTMQTGEWGIWAWSLIYHFICGGKPYGLIWVLRSTATGININRSPLKEGSWVAERFLK